MICPFSRSRLQELAWEERCTCRQIALLAQAATGEMTTASAVEEWMRAAGVAPYVPPAAAAGDPPQVSARDIAKLGRGERQPGHPKPPKPSLETRPCCTCGADVTRPRWAFKRRAFCSPACIRAAMDGPGARGGTETRACGTCGAPVTRPSHRFESETAYCGAACRHAAVQARHQAERERRRAAAVPGEAWKRCPGCGVEQGIELFSVDRSRADGRARICLACNRAQSEAYYARNAERVKARMAANRARAHGDRGDGNAHSG